MNLKYVFVIIVSTLFFSNTLMINALEESTEVRSLLRTRVQNNLKQAGFFKNLKKTFTDVGGAFTSGVKALKGIGKKGNRGGKGQNAFERAFIKTGNELSRSFKVIGDVFAAVLLPVLNDFTGTGGGGAAQNGSPDCRSVIVNAFCDNSDCDTCNAFGIASVELIARTILTGYITGAQLNTINSRNSLAYAAQCTATFAKQCAQRDARQYGEDPANFVYNADGQEMKQNDCLHMAVKQYGDKVVARRKDLVAGSWSHVPSGCTVQSGGDYAAHFNRGVGTSSGYSRVQLDPTVITEEDCMISAVIEYGEKVIAKRNKLQIGSWRHVPLGCSVQSGGDFAVHFNRHAGRKSGSYTTVIKPDSVIEMEAGGLGQLVI